MKVKNKYVIRSHISESKFRQIILLFSEDLSATQNPLFDPFKQANN